MPKGIEESVARAIAEKVFPGCVIGVVKKSGERIVLPSGNFTYDADAEKVTEDSVYDLASVTKSIPVASLAAMFIAEGKLNVADTVKNYLPELQNDHGATVEDLLMYRVQGTQLSKLRYSTFEEIRTHVLEHGFTGPRAAGTYTNLPAYVLGLILERVGGATLALLSHAYFFERLRMERTTFFPSVSDCAPTEIDERGIVRGLPHDESAYVFAKERRAVGHAGLFSTAGDILNFLEAMLKGELPEVTDAAQRGWGWQRAEPWFMGTHTSERAFGKTGFTGTSIACDMESGSAFVILSNRTYPKRPPDATSLTSAVNIFRRDIADMLLR